MIKKYIIEVSPYPQQFTVSADSESKAIQEAEARFSDKNNGASVYESNVLESEEIE